MYVLQDWVSDVGCKMQSILISGLRAPDQKTKAVKLIIRWLRGKCQINADPKKESYMQTITVSSKLIDEAMDELEYLPVHYVHHFADSLAVCAYHHQDEEVRNLCYYAHEQVAVELFHFHPESKQEFLERHTDKF